ncbi:MAG: hypothetical protein WD557_07360 [Dehalococcoidia bacterium]
MADLLVRNVREDTARSLKARAADDRRSVSAEAAQLLTESTLASTVAAIPTPGRMSREEMITLSKYWRERLAGRDLGDDSTAITRHDRDTDHGRA